MGAIGGFFAAVLDDVGWMGLRKLDTLGVVMTGLIKDPVVAGAPMMDRLTFGNFVVGCELANGVPEK